MSMQSKSPIIYYTLKDTCDVLPLGHMRNSLEKIASLLRKDTFRRMGCDLDRIHEDIKYNGLEVCMGKN